MSWLNLKTSDIGTESSWLTAFNSRSRCQRDHRQLALGSPHAGWC